MQTLGTNVSSVRKELWDAMGQWTSIDFLELSRYVLDRYAPPRWKGVPS